MLIPLLKKVETHFRQSSLWMFLTLLLFMSYLLIISVMDNNGYNFLLGFLGMVLLFWPPLLFVAGRKWLRSHLSPGLRTALWLICFVGYPLVLTFTGEPWVNMVFSHIKMVANIVATQEFLSTVAISILATEVAILLQEHWRKTIGISNWPQWSLQKTLLLLLLFLSFLAAAISLASYREMNELDWIWGNSFLFIYKYLSFVLQCFLIGLGHYLFYYFNHYYLIPTLLRKEGILTYGFSVVAVVLLGYPIIVSLIRCLPMPHELQWEAFRHNVHAANGGALPFVIIILTVPVIVSNQWFRQINKITQLEKEKSNTELRLLKQQINPHFFFNTLNNLYALSLTNDKQTPEVILQLSELMRYVIYRGKETQVSLAEEIKYLEDYMQLQRIRLHKKLDFRFSKTIVNDQMEVPPLLFIVLVENAFKHGIEPAEKACLLHLEMRQEANGELYFICKNSFETPTEKGGGIGLLNLRRRLELLFPGRYELEIQQGGDLYEVRLNIPTIQNG